MANPVQQGLKPVVHWHAKHYWGAEMANPVQQGLKRRKGIELIPVGFLAEMANPVQQGLKHVPRLPLVSVAFGRNG